MSNQGIRMKNPPHIGGFLKTEIIEGHGLSVTGAAVALGVTREALSGLLNERTSLSPDMAIRFGKAFGLPIETLMRMQHDYDVAQARQRADQIDVPPFAPEGRREAQSSRQ